MWSFLVLWEGGWAIEKRYGGASDIWESDWLKSWCTSGELCKCERTWGNSWESVKKQFVEMLMCVGHLLRNMKGQTYENYILRCERY